jgi:hypothetical protein
MLAVGFCLKMGFLPDKSLRFATKALNFANFQVCLSYLVKYVKIKYLINNKMKQLVILNDPSSVAVALLLWRVEVESLFLHRFALFSFVGQMLRFALRKESFGQHDSNARSV